MTLKCPRCKVGELIPRVEYPVPSPLRKSKVSCELCWWSGTAGEAGDPR